MDLVAFDEAPTLSIHTIHNGRWKVINGRKEENEAAVLVLQQVLLGRPLLT